MIVNKANVITGVPNPTFK